MKKGIISGVAFSICCLALSIVSVLPEKARVDDIKSDMALLQDAYRSYSIKHQHGPSTIYQLEEFLSSPLKRGLSLYRVLGPLDDPEVYPDETAIIERIDTDEVGGPRFVCLRGVAFANPYWVVRADGKVESFGGVDYLDWSNDV